MTVHAAHRPPGPHPVVTIDGPAGSGKSTIARRLAARLGYRYLSSGAIYRVVAWKVSRGARLDAVLSRLRIEFAGEHASPRVLADGIDVTDDLYAPEVSELAAGVSQVAAVRAYADDMQRRVAASGPTVVEGRDAGTVVFPHAACKFYLDASLEARAERRLGDHRNRGEALDLAAVQQALAGRDAADRMRALAPLRRAEDATYVNSSGMTADDVVELMAKEVERACSITR